MIMSLSKNELFDYVKNQLNHFFPDKYHFSGNDVKSAFDTALERSEECFRVCSDVSYHDENGNTKFSHFFGDQYAAFLYFLSNSLWKCSQNSPLCSKIFHLNQTLHSFFASYKNNLPDHFILFHPLGTVLGKAVYGDFLVVFQGVTVNNSLGGEGNLSPAVIGKGVTLASNAKIIGNKPIGDYVSIGAGALVYQKAVPDNYVVTLGENGNAISMRMRKSKHCYAQRWFNVDI